MVNTAEHPIAMSPRTRFLVLLCVSVPSFMINLDANIVAVSLPSIARALHADFARIEWVISAYTLTFAALVLPAGALADRFGRKRLLIAGLTLFTLASLICGAAPTIGILIGARAAQGLGAAMQLSAALAILSHEFRGHERARAFAFWGSVIGIGITAGPLAGGILTQFLGWQWAFYVNVPVGLVLIGLIIRTIGESNDPEAASLDVPGFVTFSAALFLLTYALISGNHLGWRNPVIVWSGTGAVVLLASFVAIELKSKRPMLELQFFPRPTFLGANLASISYAAALLTMLTYLPLFFQGGLDASPVAAGLLMLPIAIPLFVVPRIVSRHLAHRYSGRTLVALGLVLVAAGMAWIAWFAPLLAYGVLVPGLGVAGAGAGILNGETAKVGVSAIPPERAGMASGMSGTVRFTGIVLGFAALGTVLFTKIAFDLGLATSLSGASLTTLTQTTASGKLSAAAGLGILSLRSIRTVFAAGYQAIFSASAILALSAALGCWLLIRSADTAPTRKGDDDLLAPVD